MQSGPTRVTHSPLVVCLQWWERACPLPESQSGATLALADGCQVALGVSPITPYDRCGQTTAHLNTPVNNPPIDDLTEVEVTDPGHPLFGRRFVLLSTRPRAHSMGYLFVAYRDTMVLRIPQTATDLVAPPPESAPLSKLTSQAITELMSRARSQGGIGCQVY